MENFKEVLEKTTVEVEDYKIGEKIYPSLCWIRVSLNGTDEKLSMGCDRGFASDNVSKLIDRLVK